MVWCRANGERMPRPENQFSGHIVKLAGWFKGHKDINMEDEHGSIKPRRQRVVMPSTSAMEDAAKRSGSKDWRRPPDQNLLEWMTICFFTFRRATHVDA